MPLSCGARPTRREWVSLIAIGVLWFGIYNVALNEGEQRVDAGTAAMLIQLSPVLVALLAAVFLDERFTAYLGIGLALAFGGVALIGMAWLFAKVVVPMASARATGASSAD